MRVAVIGAGGVGGPFGAALARGGHDVTFVARGAHLEAMRAQGLRIEQPSGDTHLKPVQATDDPRAIGPVDAVLVTVKLWDVEAVADLIRPLIGPGTAVVPLPEGLPAGRAILAGAWFVADDLPLETLIHGRSRIAVGRVIAGFPLPTIDEGWKDELRDHLYRGNRFFGDGRLGSSRNLWARPPLSELLDALALSPQPQWAVELGRWLLDNVKLDKDLKSDIRSKLP
jgi:hypothetical protein